MKDILSMDCGVHQSLFGVMKVSVHQIFHVPNISIKPQLKALIPIQGSLFFQTYIPHFMEWLGGFYTKEVASLSQ